MGKARTTSIRIYRFCGKRRVGKAHADLSGALCHFHEMNHFQKIFLPLTMVNSTFLKSLFALCNGMMLVLESTTILCTSGPL